jgi:hypothetical protein
MVKLLMFNVYIYYIKYLEISTWEEAFPARGDKK